MSRDTGKPYAAQTRPLIDPVTPCITQLTVRSAFVLSVSADHDYRPDASWRPASLRPGERLWSGGRLGAQEPLGFDVPAHGKACPRGHRRRRRLFGGSEASGYSMAGRRAASMCRSGELVQHVFRALCQSRLMCAPPARMLSDAARDLVRARTRVCPRGSEPECSDLPSSPQIFLGGKRY